MGVGQATELPDSLEDSAEIAASSCSAFLLHAGAGGLARCRVDFDTSVGDETYTTLKSSTEFMQKFVSFLCYSEIPNLMQKRQDSMIRVAQARAELKALMSSDDTESKTDDGDNANSVEERQQQLMDMISKGGKFDSDETYEGPVARIYFPDEGSAALARRDWTQISAETNEPLVPDCVEFSSLGGVQLADTSKDALIFFFCPRASESVYVEEVLYKVETLSPNLQLTIFINPLLVDMGVTGFGMAGRMLRERLIDPLVNTYYLRTLPWGALTRKWPNAFTVWQEDEDLDTGYKLIKTMDTLPSNPDVEDIYDVANGNMRENNEGFGLLNAIGDFVNGMTQL